MIDLDKLAMQICDELEVGIEFVKFVEFEEDYVDFYVSGVPYFGKLTKTGRIKKGSIRKVMV